jgi:hypothetical protein
MKILKQFLVSIIALFAFYIVGIVSSGLFGQGFIAPILTCLGMLYSLRLMINIDDEGGLIIAVGIIAILVLSALLIFASIFLGECATGNCL